MDNFINGWKLELLLGKKVSMIVDGLNHNEENYIGTFKDINKEMFVLDTLDYNDRISSLEMRQDRIISIWEYKSQAKKEILLEGIERGVLNTPIKFKIPYFNDILKFYDRSWIVIQGNNVEDIEILKENFDNQMQVQGKKIVWSSSCEAGYKHGKIDKLVFFFTIRELTENNKRSTISCIFSKDDIEGNFYRFTLLHFKNSKGIYQNAIINCEFNPETRILKRIGITEG